MSSDLSKLITGAVFGFLWWVIFFLSDILMLGAGHGIDLFVYFQLCPGGFAIFMWPAIGALLMFRNSFWCRIVVVILLVWHYVDVVYSYMRPEGVSFSTEWHRATERFPLSVAFGSLIYLSANLVCWRGILNGRRLARSHRDGSAGK